MWQIILSFIILLSLPSKVISQRVSEIEAIINSPVSQNAVFGICILDISGNEIYTYNARTKFIPASTLKLVTTFSALDLLGENYKYITQIGYSGSLLDDGTLDGDLIIKGSGDPSLGSPMDPSAKSINEVMDLIIDFLLNQGITCIEGDVIIDESVFDDRPIHPSWAWDDLTNYYTSGAWGFNFHENLYFIDFNRSQDSGVPASIDAITPMVPGLSINSHVITGAKNSGDNAYIYGNPYDNLRWIEGTIPPGSGKFRIKGALPNPPLFAAYQIAEHLSQNGITSKGYSVVRHDKFQSFGEINSTPLIDLAHYANAVSNNLYCEAFFRSLSASKKEAGSFKGSVRQIEDLIVNSELPISQIHIEDGSGLSSRNRVSPYFQTSFINHYRSKLGDKKVKYVVPKVGEKGSVKNFLNGSPAQEGLWLKSGSINNALAYTGLLTVRTGSVYSISIMVNGHESNRVLRRQIEKIIDIVYDKF